MHILQIGHKGTIVFIEFFKIAFFYLTLELTVLYAFLNQVTFILAGKSQNDSSLSPDQEEELASLKSYITITIITLFVALWLNPIDIMYRAIRYDVLEAIMNIVIAPFGNVKFKTYLIAEIFTDCFISIQDVGRIAYYLDSGQWGDRIVKLSDPLLADNLNPGIKWIFYSLTVLPYMWRMNQNLRKWLVYNHKL